VLPFHILSFFLKLPVYCLLHALPHALTNELTLLREYIPPTTDRPSATIPRGNSLPVIGAIVFVRRRRRLSRRESAGSKFSTSSVEGGPSVTVTPFNLSPLDTLQQGSDSWTGQQQLLPEHSDGGTASDPRSLSSTPAPALPNSRPVAPVPPGLSSKELARLRTEAQQTYTQHSSDTTQSSSTPTVFTAQSGATSPSDTRRLQSEVESLRREMLQLRTERLEPPPSYTLGDV